MYSWLDTHLWNKWQVRRRDNEGILKLMGVGAQSFACFLTCRVISFTFYMILVVDQSVTFVWMLIRMKIRVYSCQENDTNKYSNIFVWTFLTRTNIRIYSYQNFDKTNIRINIRIKNIWIFEYICHTLDKTGTSSVFLQSK